MAKGSIAIVGSGPAGLMAAHFAAKSGAAVHLFEKRPAYGRKLLIAGSSGLNITHHLDPASFAKHYEGFTEAFWEKLMQDFSPSDWVSWIEKELELETFLGTSDRYFVREMKASNLLKRWQELLFKQGVHFHRNHELSDFQANPEGGLDLFFNSEPAPKSFEQAAFFLGGGSWEEPEPQWPGVLLRRGLKVLPFSARNVGYELNWSEAMISEADGLPLKKIVFRNQRGSKMGELMVTKYGLEGTPVYFLGQVGEATLDLKPDFTEIEIMGKLNELKENLSPLRRVKKKLGLSPAALALLFHHGAKEAQDDLAAFVHQIKNFKLSLLRPRPLIEAISSSGGLDLAEIDENLQSKKFSRLYLGGEMLDWHSPTGGFLIQACVSQGARVGRALATPG